MNSVDLHFHLLPGVDDGPAVMEESVALAATAAHEGTRTVVATPHVRSDHVTDVHELFDRMSELREALLRARVPLEVLLGAELGHEMVGRLGDSELDAIAQGPTGARWLLVETPFEPLGEAFHAATDELRRRGFGVLLGHPERGADAALAGSAGLARELAAGSLAQLNAGSLVGAHGGDARLAGWSLLFGGAATVLGSDAHGPTRPPALALARDVLLASGLHAAQVDALTGGAPRRLLSHGIDPAPTLVA